jgi:hypothetical protein
VRYGSYQGLGGLNLPGALGRGEPPGPAALPVARARMAGRSSGRMPCSGAQMLRPVLDQGRDDPSEGSPEGHFLPERCFIAVNSEHNQQCSSVLHAKNSVLMMRDSREGRMLPASLVAMPPRSMPCSGRSPQTMHLTRRG